MRMLCACRNANSRHIEAWKDCDEGPRHRHPQVRHPRSPGQGDRGRAQVSWRDGVASVRQGKVFDIEIEGGDRKQAEAALKQAADKLLANTLIENYDVKLIG